MFQTDRWATRDTYLVNSTPYTVEDNGTYYVDASGGAIVINLPDIATSNGRFVRVKKVDTSTNKVTVTPYGAQLINGAASMILNRRFDSTYIIAHNGGWYDESYWMMRVIQDNYADPQAFDPTTMNNYALYNAVVAASKAGNDCNISMHNAKDRTDYFRCNTTTYQVFATNIYRGKVIWTPNVALAIVSCTAASCVGRIRVWDVTNSVQVCEFATWTGTAERIISIPIVAGNLPTNQAILEFQIKYATTIEARVHAIGLYVS